MVQICQEFSRLKLCDNKEEKVCVQQPLSGIWNTHRSHKRPLVPDLWYLSWFRPCQHVIFIPAKGCFITSLISSPESSNSWFSPFILHHFLQTSKPKKASPPKKKVESIDILEKLSFPNGSRLLPWTLPLNLPRRRGIRWLWKIWFQVRDHDLLKIQGIIWCNVWKMFSLQTVGYRFPNNYECYAFKQQILLFKLKIKVFLAQMVYQDVGKHFVRSCPNLGAISRTSVQILKHFFKLMTYV